MSKRFTSLLVGTLAAVLLGVPAQAQNAAKFTRSAKAKVQLNTTRLTAGPELRQMDAQTKAEMIEKAPRDLDLNARRGAKGNQNTVLTPTLFGGRLFSDAFAVRPATDVPVRLPNYAAAPTTDANGIITTPDAGEHKFYTRAGWIYFYNNNQVYYNADNGYVEIVESADDVVYIKDIVSSYATGAWVKGTKSGNTISVPVGQPIIYNSQYAATMSPCWGAYDETNGWVKLADATIEFAIDGDVISLLDSNEDKYVGIFWDDDDSFSGNGAYESVWTLDPDYQPASTELVTPPADLQSEVWKLKATRLSQNGTSTYNSKPAVGIVGNEVYVKGLFNDFPDSWIKGTIDGDVVTFAGLQYLGEYNNSYHIWCVGADTWVDDEGYTNGELADLKFNYNADAKLLTSINDALANAADNRVYYLVWLDGITISGSNEEETAETGAPVDQLPYTNNFDTTAEQSQFGIIDSNEDGTTWYFATDTNGSGIAIYNYNQANAGDDWLITPAIKLEAGKTYAFSVDARSENSSYPERLEVLLGTAAKASALTQQVIAPIVLGTEYTTLENTNIKVEETGYYHFGLHAISDAYAYSLRVDNLVIEEGANPAAPAAVADLAVENTEGDDLGAVITFTAPAKAINGDELSGNLSVNILRDKVQIATVEGVAPGSKVTYVDEAADLTIGNHKYQVIAANEVGAGAKSDVVEVFLTAVLQVPYVFNLGATGVFDTFQIIDANNDGTTWRYNASFAGGYYPYNSYNQADDYLVSVPFRLQAGKNYSVSVNARNNQAGYTERFEVLVGTEPDPAALNITAIAPVELGSGLSDDYEGDFSVPADGIYYVAVHAISDPDQYYLIVNTISVLEGADNDAPAAPRLGVQPDPYGNHKVVLTATAPNTTIGGDQLSSITKFDLLRDGEVIKSYTDVAPEDIKVYVDKNVSGSHTYQAVAYNESGRGQKSARSDVYAGLDIPNYITNINAYETSDGVVLNWDPVTTGFNGGVVVPNEIQYGVWTGHYEQFLFWYYLVLDDEVTATSETQAAIVYDQPENQTIEYLYVMPRNAAGQADDDYAAAVLFTVGKPYALPFEESFNPSGFNYGTWVYFRSSADVTVGTSDYASDDDGGAISFSSEVAGEQARFTSGKISTIDGNLTLIFDAISDGSQVNNFQVQVQTPDGTVKNVGAPIVPTDEYATYKVSLPGFGDEDFIKVTLVANFVEEGALLLDNVKVLDLYPYNLAVSINAPKAVQAGNAANIDVTVRNVGEEKAAGYTVTLTADGKELLKETVSESLGSFEKKVLTAELPTTIFDEAGDITLKAVVDYDLELDPDDNEASANITVKQSSAAAPENVTAENTGNGVKLTWNAPSSTTEEVVDGAEEYENSDNGGIFDGVDNTGTYVKNTGNIGEWTVYDGNNGLWGYGVNGVESTMGLPCAWQVFDPAAFGLDENYPAHSGEKYFLSTSVAEPQDAIAQTDNWLISPALPGTAQTISFWVRELVADYGPESYEILYSTTDNKIESFKLLKATTCANTEWEEVSFDLPAGTTYFAIRHTSTDVWALLVDDITYTAGGGEIVGYNVYVDGELAETVTTTSIEIEFSDVVTTNSVFAVSAIYSNGAESKPVVVKLASANQEITGIEQITGSREPADIYTLDGKLVRSQATSLQGLKGAYIVNGQKVVIK